MSMMFFVALAAYLFSRGMVAEINSDPLDACVTISFQDRENHKELMGRGISWAALREMNLSDEDFLQSQVNALMKERGGK